MTGTVSAILLAGARPIPDPLAKAAGVAVKPLVPVAGEPMINRPARALLDHPTIGGLSAAGGGLGIGTPATAVGVVLR